MVFCKVDAGEEPDNRCMKLTGKEKPHKKNRDPRTTVFQVTLKKGCGQLRTAEEKRLWAKHDETAKLPRTPVKQTATAKKVSATFERIEQYNDRYCIKEHNRNRPAAREEISRCARHQQTNISPGRRKIVHQHSATFERFEQYGDRYSSDKNSQRSNESNNTVTGIAEKNCNNQTANNPST